MNRGTRSLDQDTAQEWPLVLGILKGSCVTIHIQLVSRNQRQPVKCKWLLGSDGHSRARTWCPGRHSLVEHGPSGRAYEYNAAGMD